MLHVQVMLEDGSVLGLDKSMKDRILKDVDNMAGRALRCLAFAQKVCSAVQHSAVFVACAPMHSAAGLSICRHQASVVICSTCLEIFIWPCTAMLDASRPPAAHHIGSSACRADAVSSTQQLLS